MSLKYALLALLTGSSMTGYDIGKRFGSSVGHVWNAPPSQIYPELRRLARDGLLEVEEVRDGRQKKIYSITPAGVADFKAWMNVPLIPDPSRDLHILRAAYLDWADADAARAQLQLLILTFTERLSILQAVRESLLNGTHPILAERLRDLAPDQHRRATVFKAFAFEGMIQSLRQQIDWAKQGLDLIRDLEEPVGPPPSLGRGDGLASFRP